MIDAAIAIARRLPWRYIGLALAIIGLALAIIGALWFAFDTGRDNMRAKLQPRIDLLTRERDAARENVATLKAAVKRQNAAIAAAADKTKAAQDMAADARKRGQERAPAVAGTLARLDAVQASGGQCVTPDAVKDAWGKM